MASDAESAKTVRILVTGANSGLGFAICQRLIDEFLYTRPQHEQLGLILTTRDQRKSDATVARLKVHLNKTISQIENECGLKGFGKLLEARVAFEPERLDLTSLLSVRALANKRLAQGSPIHTIILNAGIGGWTNLNWFQAVWNIVTDPIQALTYPQYKLSGPPTLTAAQTPQPSVDAATDAEKEAELDAANSTKGVKIGRLFCSNVFGHYMLAHWLAPLLRSATPDGRIVWVSSVEAYSHTFDPSDLQCLRTTAPYEASKRLTDVLALTFSRDEITPWRTSFLSSSGSSGDTTRDASTQDNGNVRMFSAHPGICATDIFPLPWILTMAMLCTFYAARWLGSIWHVLKPYKGATAPVWLALAPMEQLQEYERRDGVAKWGSACDSRGNERVERTEVEGWGFGGVVGDCEVVDRKGRRKVRAGRKRGVKALTEEDRTAFLELGRDVWSRMEELRAYWEGMLQDVE